MGVVPLLHRWISSSICSICPLLPLRPSPSSSCFKEFHCFSCTLDIRWWYCLSIFFLLLLRFLHCPSFCFFFVSLVLWFSVYAFPFYSFAILQPLFWGKSLSFLLPEITIKLLKFLGVYFWGVSVGRPLCLSVLLPSTNISGVWVDMCTYIYACVGVCMRKWALRPSSRSQEESSSLRATGRVCFAYKFIYFYILHRYLRIPLPPGVIVCVCRLYHAPNIPVSHVLPNNFWYLLPTGRTPHSDRSRQL